jgi:hypothetical protein
MPDLGFWRRFRSEGECIVWTGSHNDRGYGTKKIDGKVTYTHRKVYEDLVGPIPKGHDLHHYCENPPCANVHHLVALSRREHYWIGNA